MEKIGKYKVIRELGAGGFGAVYLAEDTRFSDIKVAIKVFKVRDENLAGQATSSSTDAIGVLQQRFMDEYQTLHKLSANPYIVNIRDFDELEDGTPYYVMPYLPQSLETEIGKDAFSRGKLEDTPKHLHPRKLASQKALSILEQILDALSAVHQAGLVHRDIKPANILFDEQGNVQLCDFGIAKLPDAEHSQSGVGMGSRNYMSPEQRESAKHVMPASDVYSVGVLAYRMLTGQLPSIPFKPPKEFAPEIGDKLNELLINAISQQEQDRPQDGADFLKQFKQAIKGVTESQDVDEATGTWVDDKTADIKAELKPLKNKIIALLHTQGEIKDSDKIVLQALADIGNVDAAGLSALIEQIIQQQVDIDPQQKAFQQWVLGVNKQHQQHNKTLSQAQISALVSAGEATTGKTAAELTQIIEGKNTKAHSHDKANNPPTKTTNKGVGKSVMYSVVLILLIGGGYFGYQGYQQQQIEQQQQAIAQKNEQAAWQQAIKLNTVQSYQLYLDTWPTGKHKQQAKAAIDKLQEQARLAKLSTEQQQTELTKQAQQLLIKHGYTVSENGMTDTRTQKAIEAFEKSEGLLVTGAVDNILISELVKSYETKDNAAWDKAKNSHTSRGYQTYLTAFPQGQYVKQAKTAHNTAKKAEQRLMAKTEAKKQDESAWSQAKQANTINAYQTYLAEQTTGTYRQQAQQKIAAIELENSKVALTITTTPSDAKVEILNIKDKYQAGIRLLPKTYTIKVSKQGYHSQNHTATLRSDNKSFSYQLEKAMPPAIKQLVNSIVSIPAGSFMMGSENGDDDEKPVHRVNIKAFKLMQTEVTWAMYQPCIDAGACPNNNSVGGDKGWGKGNRPVINVSWNDITQHYIPWLNKHTGQKFRLPSEAEWEYAARAGSTTKFSWGNYISCSQARYGNYDGDCGNDRKTVSVKSFSPNAFGLYDMHGNVWEWTQDCWNVSYQNAPNNGSAWTSGNCDKRVLRGGSWYFKPASLRSAYRYINTRTYRNIYTGFRLVLSSRPGP
ncbi:bifunctional serine/threonine-protein kinase/formylglycine-generating enzyme family protein [uncultured Paraglaciecola sp.]|uniref:bifunctional serine/threonine-protein kinase/formylglycine-generating enzyme family protein n=1 Tax=uncultured Paraglaciecola sp. TaxID=1765024 RepID=UPI0026345577|nr:bifunctional serine/threonine-protein kinase/formylglycine-generating enzyme family protein [uncultured Paraglaciecola sp.]